MAEYSYLVLRLPRETSRDAARRILTDHAEYGHWELSKLRLYADGSRKATLRRKVIRAARTRLPSGPGPVARYPYPGQADSGDETSSDGRRPRPDPPP